MSSKPSIILGTGNRNKAVELLKLLAPAGVELQTLADFPEAIEVVEDGQTFAENARLKACQQARHLKRWVLAEDSGLMVDALDGAPGVFSARYSGPGATDASNNRKLLDELGDLPAERRSARFVCHMTLSDPSGEVRAESEESCRGRIRFSPRGEHGFGYDPLFDIVEYHRPFAEMGPLVKSYLSHRSRAARAMLPQLIGLVDAGEIVG